MLVLTRKKNESIVLDNQIVIKILQVKGNRIRLGVSAPADVAIRRGELDPLAVSTEEMSTEEIDILPLRDLVTSIH